MSQSLSPLSFEEREVLLTAAVEADPTTHPWGYLAWHSGMACGPCSFGAFSWYQTREDMFNALAEHEFYYASEPEGEPDAELLAEIAQARAITTRLADAEIDEKTAAAALSKINSALTIEWIGRFAELCSGDSEMALEVRERFWQHPWDCDCGCESAPPEDTSPISPEDYPELIEILQIWGA